MEKEQNQNNTDNSKENNEEKERSSKGIPYHPEVIEWFRSITSELNVDFNF